MPAPDNTGLQVNVKTTGGTLINVYASDEADLSAKLEVIERVAPQVAAIEGVYHAASAVSSVAAPPSQQPQQGEGAPGAAPTCNHGARIWRQGVAKATGKPYKMWACPSQDRNAQCPPQWAN